MLSRNRIILYLAIALICFLSITLCFSFYYGPDPAYQPNGYDYVVDAYTIGTPGGAAAVLNYDYMLGPRLILIGAIHLFMQLLGVSRFSSVLFDVLCLVGTDILIFLIGKEIYGTRAGLFAALLYSFFPLAVFDALSLGDNVPMAFFVTLAIFLMIISAKQKDKRKRLYMVSLSSFIAIIGFMITPEEILILPVLFILLIKSRHAYVNKDFIGFSAALIAGILLMMLIGVMLSNNPFEIYKSNALSISDFCSVNHGSCGNSSPIMIYLTQMFPQGISSLNNILAYLHINLAINPVSEFDFFSPYYYGIYSYVVLLALCYLIFKKEKRMTIPLIWILWCFLYLSFGTASIHYYTNGIWYPLPRYTLIIWPALVLILGFGMDSLITTFEKYKTGIKRFTIILPYLLLGYMLFILFSQSFSSIQYTAMQQYGQIFEIVEVGNYTNTLPSNAILYDTYQIPAPAFTNFQHTFYFFSSLPPCNYVNGVGYIIYFYNASMAKQCNLTIAYAAPPPSSTTGTLYTSFVNSYYKNLTVYYKAQGGN